MEAGSDQAQIGQIGLLETTWKMNLGNFDGPTERHPKPNHDHLKEVPDMKGTVQKNCEILFWRMLESKRKGNDEKEEIRGGFGDTRGMNHQAVIRMVLPFVLDPKGYQSSVVVMTVDEKIMGVVAQSPQIQVLFGHILHITRATTNWWKG